VIPGDELDALRFVVMPEGGALLLVAASESNPDLVAQSFALVDVGESCAVRYSETVRLPHPLGEVIAPETVPAGVLVDEHGLSIVDDPQRVRLAGTEGEVELLLSIRERRVTGTSKVLGMPERRRSMLEERALKVTTPERELAEVRDGDDATSVDLAADAAVTLESDAPLRILEVHHGCAGAPEASFDLLLAGNRWSTKEPPPPDSWIQAAGRAAPGSDVHRRLLVLREPATKLELSLRPGAAPVCLRELRAYALR
jgi:hypothetical protein